MLLCASLSRGRLHDIVCAQRGTRLFFCTMLHRPFIFFGPWILALALGVGFLYALPPFLIKAAVEEEGRFFVLPNLNHLSDDTLYYFPRAREIYDGHSPVDMHFSDYKDTAWFIFPLLPQVVTAGFIWLNAGDVGAAVIGLIFVFGIINFLCFYAVGRVVLRSRLWAVLLASISTMTHAALRIPEAFYDKGVALDIVANMIPILRRPAGELSLVRIDDPLLTMPLYLISFLLLHRFWQRPDTRRALAFGAALGVLTYVYFYYWVMILAIALIAFLYALAMGCRNGSYAGLKPWGTCAAVFGLFFVPHIVNFFLFRSLPGAADYIARKGVETGWGFRTSVYPDYLFYAALGTAAFFLLRRRRPDASEPTVSFSFVAVLLAAMVLLWNTQAIIGFNMEPFHWWKTFAPLLLILTSVVVKEASDRWIYGDGSRRVLYTAMVLLCIFIFAKKTLNAAAFIRPAPDVVRSYSLLASLEKSYEWIRNNLPPEATIISHSLGTSLDLTIYTSANPFFAHPLNTLAPTDVLERRFAEAHNIMGASADDMTARISGPPFTVPADICLEPCAYDPDRMRNRTAFSFEYRPHETLYAALFNPRLTFDSMRKVSSAPIPPERIRAMREHYDAYRMEPDAFPEHTYLYIGPREQLLSRGRVPAYPEFTVVFANEDVRILRVR